MDLRKCNSAVDRFFERVEPSVATKIFLYIVSLLGLGSVSLVEYLKNLLTHINDLKDRSAKLYTYA